MDRVARENRASTRSSSSPANILQTSRPPVTCVRGGHEHRVSSRRPRPSTRSPRSSGYGDGVPPPRRRSATGNGRRSLPRLSGSTRCTWEPQTNVGAYATDPANIPHAPPNGPASTVVHRFPARPRAGDSRTTTRRSFVGREPRASTTSDVHRAPGRHRQRALRSRDRAGSRSGPNDRPRAVTEASIPPARQGSSPSPPTCSRRHPDDLGGPPRAAPCR